MFSLVTCSSCYIHIACHFLHVDSMSEPKEHFSCLVPFALLNFLLSKKKALGDAPFAVFDAQQKSR